MAKESTAFSARKKCLLCGEVLSGEHSVNFFNMPESAQNIPNAEQVSTDKGLNINLFQCPWCGLVQFDCDPVDYYRDVIRAGGYSTTMVELRRKQYSHLINTYGLQAKRFLEVGCGQGEFLSVLTEFPVEAYGIEHTPRLVELARSKGLHVDVAFLEYENTIIDNGPFDVFLSFNFLEHQPDPNGMLKGIYHNLTEDGMGLITVPSFEYILEKSCYYEFIRDHLAYYTFDTLCFALQKNGFEVLEKELVNRDTLAIIVKKKKKADFSHILEKQKDLYSDINAYINYYAEQGKKVAIWGASHQGFTLASTTGIGTKLECIIDSAPFKQGRFSPASHVPIVSPLEATKKDLSAIIIVAPGYTNEITNTIEKLFSVEIEIATLRTDTIEIIRKFGGA